MAAGLVRLGQRRILPPPTAKPYGMQGLPAPGVGTLTRSVPAGCSILDFFESGNLNDYSGDTGEFSIVTGWPYVYSGDYALKYPATSSGGLIYQMTPTVALDHYFTFWAYHDHADAGDSFIGFLFARQGGGTYYMVMLQLGPGLASISYFDGLEDIEIASGELNTVFQSYTTVYVEWTADHDIVLKYNGIPVCSGNDDTLESGGWGWRNDGSTTPNDAYVDGLLYCPL